MSKYLVLDIETTTHSTFKRKGNPFNPANWVVMAGWQSDTMALPEARRYSMMQQSHEWLFQFLIDPESQLLVGQNIKFDLLYLLRDPVVYAAYQDYVVRGGNVWDTQLAEYLLDGQAQSSHMLSLDELAVRYGCDLKVDEVKKLWEAGVPTEEIDPDLLTRYLIGETLPSGERREGDVGNTHAIFKAQLGKARKSGQLRSILLNMGSLMASTEMERNGMFVNKALGLELAADLEKRLGEAKLRLQEYLPADLPFEFSWTNRYHLSPIIFGGKIKYQRRQYDLKDGRTTWFSPDEKPAARDLFAYAQKDEVRVLMKDGTEVEQGHWRSKLHGGHYEPTEGWLDATVTYASGKNKGEPKTKKVKVDDYTKPKSRMVDAYWEFPGYTVPDPAWASSTDGLYSVGADIMEELANRNVPFLKDLTSVKAMEKDLGTYYITWNESKGEHVGMLTLVQDDSIIHHSLNHTSTVTGRFSSSNPNLQNIPKGNKSDVKTVFESRFGADGHIIQSDFSSLEVYIQAILTGAVNLIADLKAGTDLHVMRLSLKEHMDYQEVFNLCKGYTDANGVYHDAIEEWDYKRTGAKVFSFQRAYGAGAKKISESTGMPIEEVEALIEAEQRRYPEIDVYFEKRTAEIKKNRVPTDRRIPHPDMPAVIVQLGVSRVSTPDGKRYTYMESPSPKFAAQRGEFSSFSPTEIKNYEVQGGGGEWMKAAMWLALREFYRTRNFDSRAFLVNTVHDAQYADAHKDVRLEVGVCLQACMEAASDFMEWWFNWPLPLPVPTDTVWGANMGEENKYKDEGFKDLVKEYRGELRSRYMSGYTPSYLQ